jgi:hypothetical protein
VKWLSLEYGPLRQAGWDWGTVAHLSLWTVEPQPSLTRQAWKWQPPRPLEMAPVSLHYSPGYWHSLELEQCPF